MAPLRRRKEQLVLKAPSSISTTSSSPPKHGLPDLLWVQAASVLQAPGFHGDVTVFRLKATVVDQSGTATTKSTAGLTTSTSVALDWKGSADVETILPKGPRPLRAGMWLDARSHTLAPATGLRSRHILARATDSTRRSPSSLPPMPISTSAITGPRSSRSPTGRSSPLGGLATGSCRRL
jgi:hypothetical protein